MSDLNYFKEFASRVADFYRSHPSPKITPHQKISKTSIIEFLKSFDESLIDTIEIMSKIDNRPELQTEFMNFKEIISSRLIAQNKPLEKLVFEIVEFLQEVKYVSKAILLDKDHHPVFKKFLFEQKLFYDAVDRKKITKELLDTIEEIVLTIEKGDFSEESQKEISENIVRVLSKNLRIPRRKKKKQIQEERDSQFSIGPVSVPVTRKQALYLILSFLIGVVLTASILLGILLPKL